MSRAKGAQAKVQKVESFAAPPTQGSVQHSNKTALRSANKTRTRQGTPRPISTPSRPTKTKTKMFIPKIIVSSETSGATSSVQAPSLQQVQGSGLANVQTPVTQLQIIRVIQPAPAIVSPCQKQQQQGLVQHSLLPSSFPPVPGQAVHPQNLLPLPQPAVGVPAHVASDTKVPNLGASRPQQVLQLPGQVPHNEQRAEEVSQFKQFQPELQPQVIHNQLPSLPPVQNQ